MFQINDDLSIYATRGDVVSFYVSAVEGGSPYTFKAGDVLRMKVFEKKACENVVMQKDFPIEADAENVEIYLTENDTRIGSIISKPKDYWYEVELNPLNNPQTIIGYDEDGAKVFKLFPEGKDAEVIEEEEVPLIRELQGSIEKNAEDIGAHKSDCTNPHKVTAEQVGARPDTWMPTAAETGAIASVNGVTPDKDGNVEIPIPKGAVLYEQQDLTEEQKASARQNIGAAPNRVFVKADEVQELTHQQMSTARYNINAASVEDVTKRTEYDGFVDEDVTSTLTIEDGCFYGKNFMKLEQPGQSCTSLMPVKFGDKFKISSVYGYYSPLIAEFDSTKTMVSYTAQIDGTEVPVTDYEYTVPSGISYIAINSRYQQTKPLVVKKVVVDSVKHRIAKLEKGGTGGGTGEIPTTLPNPHPLRFTGAVNAEYDGSKEVEVEIPAGGGGGEWNLVADITLAEDVSNLSITTDTDGNNIADQGYSEVYVTLRMLAKDGYAGKNSALTVWFSGGFDGSSSVTLSSGGNGYNEKYNAIYAVLPPKVEETLIRHGIVLAMVGGQTTFKAGDNGGIEHDNLRTDAGLVAGSRIIVYGR